MRGVSPLPSRILRTSTILETRASSARRSSTSAADKRLGRTRKPSRLKRSICSFVSFIAASPSLEFPVALIHGLGPAVGPAAEAELAGDQHVDLVHVDEPAATGHHRIQPLVELRLV